MSLLQITGTSPAGSSEWYADLSSPPTAIKTQSHLPSFFTNSGPNTSAQNYYLSKSSLPASTLPEPEPKWQQQEAPRSRSGRYSESIFKSTARMQVLSGPDS